VPLPQKCPSGGGPGQRPGKPRQIIKQLNERAGICALHEQFLIF